MARINIDTGAVGNPATGDSLRTAMTKINTNFTEVYSLVRDGSSGLIATDVTNGDLKLQANGTGAIEIDTLSITNSTITSITTNSDITLTPNGTGNVVLGNFTFNADQTVGSGQDNFVFTYDHSTGTIGLEASAAGDVTASSTTTFTNKTFDANGTGNSISNIDIADFTSGVFLDEDNMASNSATAIASQQSIKAYVDSVGGGGNGMTFTGDDSAGINIADGGQLYIQGGTGITTSANSDGTITITASGGSGLQSRATKSGTTASLANAAEGDLDITGFKAYALLTITTDRAARVRLYVTAATRTADASRAEGVDPTSDAGVIAEVITTGAETVIISPGAYGFNLESSPTTTIPCRVTNKSGGTATVQVTLNVLQLEA